MTVKQTIVFESASITVKQLNNLDLGLTSTQSGLRTLYNYTSENRKQALEHHPYSWRQNYSRHPLFHSLIVPAPTNYNFIQQIKTAEERERPWQGQGHKQRQGTFFIACILRNCQSVVCPYQPGFLSFTSVLFRYDLHLESYLITLKVVEISCW